VAESAGRFPDAAQIDTIDRHLDNWGSRLENCTISYRQLTTKAERQIQDYVTLARTAGDDAERAAMRASAVSLFAFWLGFVNTARKNCDEAALQQLNDDERRLLALVRSTEPAEHA